MPFEISPNDFATVALLIFMEGILSIDNALVLAMIARKLPKEQQTKALTYGLVGAIVFRIFALFSASFLMRWTWVKFVGGGYLIWVAVSHWWSGHEDGEEDGKAAPASFWKAVLLIELTDIAFAVDSILAAVALSNKLWVIVLGGVIGIICMRFAAKGFITFLERFPNFASTAYVLVFGIGLKLVVDGFHFEGVDFHSSSSPAFWVFWGFIALSVGYGFLPKRNPRKLS